MNDSCVNVMLNKLCGIRDGNQFDFDVYRYLKERRSIVIRSCLQRTSGIINDRKNKLVCSIIHEIA